MFGLYGKLLDIVKTPKNQTKQLEGTEIADTNCHKVTTNKADMKIQN